jgi:signal peptidase II
VHNVQVGRRIAVAARRPGLLFAGVLLCVVLLDQLTKAVVRAYMRPDQSIPLIPDLVHLTYVRNTGAAFGLMSGQRPVFVLTGVMVLLAIASYWLWQRPRAKWLVLALGLVGGGASGNLMDRVFGMGLVTDFFDVQLIPVFNVADTCIVTGVAMLVVWILLGPEGDDSNQLAPIPDEGVPGGEHVE